MALETYSRCATSVVRCGSAVGAATTLAESFGAVVGGLSTPPLASRPSADPGTWWPPETAGTLPGQRRREPAQPPRLPAGDDDGPSRRQRPQLPTPVAEVPPSTAGRCQLNDGSVASKGTSRLPAVRHVPVTAGRAGQLPTTSRPRVLSRSSLSASTLDFDTEGRRPGDGSKRRVDVRRALASAIAHHNPMVTTKAVTTPHDDTAIRKTMMNGSNGCSLEPRRSNDPPNVDPSPSDLSKRYPTSPATHGSFSGSSRRHIKGRSEAFGDALNCRGPPALAPSANADTDHQCNDSHVAVSEVATARALLTPARAGTRGVDNPSGKSYLTVRVDLRVRRRGLERAG